MCIVHPPTDFQNKAEQSRLLDGWTANVNVLSGHFGKKGVILLALRLCYMSIEKLPKDVMRLILLFWIMQNYKITKACSRKRKEREQI